jgi:DNA repair protein RadC
MNLLTNNLAEVKITYSSKIPACDRIKIRCSQDADKALRLIWPSFEHREFFYIMLLNRSNQILGFSQISMGGISGTVTDVRIIFQTAIKANACGLILAHNHPSGNLSPSEADIAITKKVREAGKFLDITIMDHLILTEDSYLSMADDNLMNF